LVLVVLDRVAFNLQSQLAQMAEIRYLHLQVTQTLMYLQLVAVLADHMADHHQQLLVERLAALVAVVERLMVVLVLVVLATIWA
jgi:hypothetical protein